MAPSATRLAGGRKKDSAADVGEEALHTGYRYGNFTLLYAPVT
jgi:hypothetical protein